MRIPLKLNTGSLLIILLLLSAVSCALPQQFSNYLRSRLDLILSPLADGGTYMTTTVRSRSQDLELRATAPVVPQSQVDAKDQEISYLHSVLVMQRDYYERQLAELRDAKGFYGEYHDFPCELIPGRVVAADALPYEQGRTIRADKLSNGAFVTTRELITNRSKELPRDLSVLTSTGLVGQIASAGEFTARMRLLTDSNFKINCQIWRDPAVERKVLVKTPGGEQALPLTAANNSFIEARAKGDGKKGLVIDDVMDSYNVREGDWLVTRGSSLEMPGHVRIAQVKKVTVNRNNPLMRIVYAEPYVDLDTLRDVYIVLPLTVPPQGGAK